MVEAGHGCPRCDIRSRPGQFARVGAREGEAPVLVTSAAIRPFVRSLVERFRSQTTVLSQASTRGRS